ncbi:hypothetical protein BASA60_004092 [Batrachochytrium salamandrivorans]|nr:hypothetical protein BASA60_004092 [Batrachochytrium salamandrivorans]
MWVNFDSKQSHYDGKANPYPDLDIFRKTYVGMTDEQFSLGLTRIFNKMRDLHTLYYKAGPYSCFSLSTGLFFKFVDDSLGSSTPPKVRVVGMNDTPEILDLIGNVLSAVAVGDELLTINGLSFHDWYDQNKFSLGFGANDSGGHRGAFQYLEGVSGSSNILPEVDDITFQLKRLAPTSLRQKRSALGNGAELSGNNTLHRRDADIHRRSYWGSVQFEDTKIDDLTWTIWKNRGRNMGVIRIDSFSPVLKDTKEDTNFMVLIVTIRDLLVNQLKDTDSVLFDVRGNGGGLISAADGIIQLFKPDVTASQFRYLKNEVTKDLFYNGPDRGIGTVFGEDETTGGGGANVLSSDDDYFTDRPLKYIVDPFKAKLTGKTPSHKFYTKITVGIRQLVRSGNYAGQLIEDNGVKSDVVVRSTIDDILPGDKGISAYDRIAGYLSDVAQRQMDGKTYFISGPYSRFVFSDSVDIPLWLLV